MPDSEHHAAMASFALHHLRCVYEYIALEIHANT
jgi:hypothetical protein